MAKNYNSELEGQLDFFHDYLVLIDNSLFLEDVIGDNNDGVLNGNLLEFKLQINDLNAVLFQSIKYLSARRIKGKPIPANIILVSLNEANAYVYESDDYLLYIEQVFIGGASRNNIGFVGGSPSAIFRYKANPIDQAKLISLLRSNDWTKINLDDNCIVGWAEKFYRENKEARKADFIGDSEGKVKIIGEIRKPDKFKEYIYPYTGRTNVKFQYLMDRLNDVLQKKNLGAFYTPELYAKKSLELVRQAINRVPKGNDYVIIDRCAGTGNLQKWMTDEELSHCVLSTVEYYEYKVLIELLGDKVRHIIPPTEEENTFNMGLVRGADALSRDYVEHPLIKKYLNNPNCTIILFENPPYAETTSIEHQKRGKGASSSTWKKSFVVQQMKKEVKGQAVNDLGNVFIWSAFKYYIRQPTDSYIVYSPVKYWKAQHLINKELLQGFAFNRLHFHTNIDACIMCALWTNNDQRIEQLIIHAYEIDKNILFFEGELDVRRIHNRFSQYYYDKRILEDDKDDGIVLGFNGFEQKGGKIRLKPKFNRNIIGYLTVETSGFDNPDLHSSLLVAGLYGSNGFYLRDDNYLEKLPMFAASRYITYNRHWTERARIMKSADGAERFHHDFTSGEKSLHEFLLRCLLFTCMETQNHMRSLYGSDGRFYRNELCLDTTNGETIASIDIKKLSMTIKEQGLIQQWELVLSLAKTTANYNPAFTYGVYQVIDELNTTHKDAEDILVYDYPELNGHLNTLKKLVREYYLANLVDPLFKYEFLK